MSTPETNSNNSVELPAPTAWPLVFSLGIVLLGAGLGLHYGFAIVGILVFAVGLKGWIGELLPGRGHEREAFAPARPTETQAAPGTVESLKPGVVGYRFRLPEHVHPISAGAKGGLVGGLLMPIPAIAWGLIEYGSPWLPINLLAGMVIPGITDAALESLTKFNLMALVIGLVIHAAFSITFGLMYGVILPMLPTVKGGPILYGGVLMPILWTGVCHSLMGIVNPLLGDHVNWRWFFLSQVVYGVAMSYVVFRTEKVAVSQAPPRLGSSHP